MLDREDLLPEEQTHPELLKELQTLYQMQPDEAQLLLRTRERLAKRPIPLTFSSAKGQWGKSKQAQKPLSLATRPWLRNLNTLAAVLIVALIVGALLSTFALIRNAQTGKNNTSQVASSHAPAPRLVQLTEGERLHMVNAKDGWSIGASAQDSWGSVLRTTDGGKTWKPVTPSGIHSVSDLYILDSKTAWLPIWDLKKNTYPVWLYRTIDGGATWQRFNYPGSEVSSLTFIDQNHGWVVKTQQPEQNTSTSQSQQTLQDITRQKPVQPKNTLLRTNDGGKTWQNVAPFPTGMGGIVYFIDEQTGWTTGADKPGPEGTMSIYITHNGGKTWQKQSLSNNTAIFITRQLIFFDRNTGYFLARTTKAPIRWYAYITHDGGNSWQRNNAEIPNYVRELIDDQHAVGSTLKDTKMQDIVLLNITNKQKVSLHPDGKGTLIDYSFLSTQSGFALKQVSSSVIDLYKTGDGGKTWLKVSTLPKAA